MSSVDPLFAQWLMSEALQHVEADGVLAARWGETALKTSRVTTIATKEDASAEALRQLAFLGGPLVIEEHQLPGAWGRYLGQVITVTIDRLGYDEGVDVFLIGAEDNRSTGWCKATVIRRL